MSLFWKGVISLEMDDFITARKSLTQAF